MNRSMIRRMTITLLALFMMLASAVPALADGKGNGHGKGKGNGNVSKFQLEVRGNGNGWGNGKGKLEFKLDFDDVNVEAEWARKYIASLAAKKVFEGYTDGTFQPNKPVTRIEAVTAAVRLMGLREEASDPDNWNVDIQFDDEKQIRMKHNWAVGYVVVAQEEGLFDERDGKLQPQKAADRLWVTELLIRALDLEAEAQANLHAKLDFKDSDEIPAGLLGYVKVALDKGIITGYTNGTFKPNKPVTRAELAAMLERAEGSLPEEEDEDSSDQDASGVIVSEVSNHTLILQKDGNIQVYALDPNAFVFRDGKKVSITSLQVGDTVFVRSYHHLVIFVEVIKQAEEKVEPFTKTGYLHAMTFDEKGKISAITISESLLDTANKYMYIVDKDVVIEGKVNELQQGRIITLEGEDMVVKKIKIGDQTFRLQGKLAYVTLNSDGQIATIAIRHSVNGNTQTSIYSVSSDVRITGNLTLLGEGQDVTISGTYQVITEIVIGS